MKKTSHIIVLIITLVFCFSICGCNNAAKKSTVKTKYTISQTNKKNQSECSPLLYKVTDDEGNAIWLFGSIHIGTDDYYPLPDYVNDAYDDSEILAVECDIVEMEKDTQAQIDALMHMVYRDGTKIDDHIPKKLYEDAKDIIDELDNYVSAYDNYYPVLWSNLIDSLLAEKLGGDGELGIDRHFLERAKDDDKTIDEIESVDFQYEMMSNFSEELQILLLESSIESYEDIDETKKELKELLALWASGNEKEFIKYLSEEDEDLAKDEEELYEEYREAVLTDRNLLMADYAEDVLDSGDEVFICVGAAHVIGEGALTELLTERGYTVTIITE